MRKLLSILLLFFSVAIQAQSRFIEYPDIDNLKTVLAQSKEDTNKVFVYTNLAHAYKYVNPDSTISYGTKGLALAKRLGFGSGEILSLLFMGEALAFQGNLAAGLKLKLDALRKAEAVGDSSLLEFTCTFIGANYFYSNDYKTALHYYDKVKAYSNFQINNNKYVLGAIGGCYLGLNNLDSAYYYTKQAYDLDRKDTYHWGNPYMDMGNIEKQRGNYAKALQYFREESAVLGAPSSGLVSTFQKMGQQDSALYYAKTLLQNKDASFMYMLSATELLTSVYKSNRQIDSAFKYQEMLLALKDSVYSQEKIKQLKNLETGEQLRVQQLEQAQKEAQQQYRNRIRVNALAGSLFTLLAIALVLYRSNRNKQKANKEIGNAYKELQAMQAQLVQSEKMASLGELTAGIAHEIQNPLNFVNNFAETNTELLAELQEEIDKGHVENVKALSDDVIKNNHKITHHGKRADAIVKGMLQHARTNSGQKEATDLNKLVDEYLRLAYHGLRAKDKTFNAKIETQFDENISKINIVPQDFGRVLLNLFNNAFYAVHEKGKKLEDSYEALVTVSTRKCTDKVEIKVSDNGIGISKSVQDKIFQPFFTTKPTGQGTGLGLSLSYDIVKAHGGELKVESEEGEGATFWIYLPSKPNV